MSKPVPVLVLAPTQLPNVSPFDRIRHVDADGEWWSAREAMPFLGYRNWQNMSNVIRKAKDACRRAGANAEEQFREFTEPSTCRVQGERYRGGRPRGEARLTRLAMYLIAVNGYAPKAQVSAAQTYFAVQTPRAELINSGEAP
jgi:DNA-damage-inducible protein D